MFLLLSFPFIQQAFIAGTFIAIIAALVGYFLLIRGLTFAGHALAHIGFAGAAGALVMGIDPTIGLMAFTTLAAIGIGYMGRELHERDITIGVVMTFLLGLGALFISLYKGYAERAYSILFGSIVGISINDVWMTICFSIVICLFIVFLYRPLLFSSFDQHVAESRGVPIRLLSIFILVLTAITVSLSVQVVGVLLIFTLLIGPAAVAIRLVHQPFAAIVTAMILGIICTWLGIFFAMITNIPVSFYIATISFFVYVLVRISTL